MRPVGAAVHPTTLHQLCHAIKCVVRAIWFVHHQNWLHTDIRWSNIVKLADDNWFVIDCYNACEIGSNQAIETGGTHGLTGPWSPIDDRRQIVNNLINRVQRGNNAQGVVHAFSLISNAIIVGQHVATIEQALNAIITENADFKIVIL